MFRPPLEQDGKTLLLGFNGPVKFRREIVEPAAGQPFPRIGIDFCVGVHPPDLLRITRPPDAFGTDAEFHPRFQRLDGMIDALDELIDVRAPPTVTTQTAGNAKFPPAVVVGKI